MPQLRDIAFAAWLGWGICLGALHHPAFAQQTPPAPRQYLASPVSLPATTEQVAPRKLQPRNTSEQSPSSAAGKSSTSGAATTVTSLVCILLLIGGCYLAVRNKIPRTSGVLPPQVVQVLGRRYLDHRQSIQLVRIGSRILILAHSPQHGLQTLCEITDPVEIDLLAGLCQQQSAPLPVTFAQLLWKSSDGDDRQGETFETGRSPHSGDLHQEPTHA